MWYTGNIKADLDEGLDKWKRACSIMRCALWVSGDALLVFTMPLLSSNTAPRRFSKIININSFGISWWYPYLHQRPVDPSSVAKTLLEELSFMDDIISSRGLCMKTESLQSWIGCNLRVLGLFRDSSALQNNIQKFSLVISPLTAFTWKGANGRDWPDYVVQVFNHLKACFSSAPVFHHPDSGDNSWSIPLWLK